MHPKKLLVIGTLCFFVFATLLTPVNAQKAGLTEEEAAAIAVALYAMSTSKIMDELLNFEKLTLVAVATGKCYGLKSKSHALMICSDSITEAVRVVEGGQHKAAGYVLSRASAVVPAYSLELKTIEGGSNKPEITRISLFITNSSLRMVPDSLAMRIMISEALSTLNLEE